MNNDQKAGLDFNLAVAAGCTRDLAQALGLYARTRGTNPFWHDLANAEARLSEVLFCNADGDERKALPSTTAMLDAFHAWRTAQGAEFDAFVRLQKELDGVLLEVRAVQADVDRGFEKED